MSAQLTSSGFLFTLWGIEDGKRDSPVRDEYNQIHYILKEFSELNTTLWSKTIHRPKVILHRCSTNYYSRHDEWHDPVADPGTRMEMNHWSVLRCFFGQFCWTSKTLKSVFDPRGNAMGRPVHILKVASKKSTTDVFFILWEKCLGEVIG